MGAGETVSATAPSDSMVSEEGNKFSKSQNRAISNQAYYGTGPMPPPYFTPNAAPAATYSIVFENQWPVLQRNVAQMQAPILYPQNGPFTHPHVVAGLASTTSEVQGNMRYQKDWDAMRKCSGSSENFEAVGDRVGESNRTARGSECQNTTQSRHEDLADKSEAKAHHNEVSAIEKRSNQMLAEGSDAKNYNVSHFGGANNQVSDMGNYLVSVPQPHLNMMSSNVPSGKSKSKSKSKVVRITESSVSAVSTKTGGGKEVKTDQPTQDEHELIKERKRLAHNEAAKRSRIRRQQTCETLQTKVEELSTETSKLKQCLNRYSKDCMKLRRKNKALLDELRQKCSPEVFATLQSLNPDPDQTESPSDSSSDESSNSGSNVEADSE